MYNKFINVMKQGLNWFVWKLIIGYMYIFPPIKWRHTMSNTKCISIHSTYGHQICTDQ